MEPTSLSLLTASFPTGQTRAKANFAVFDFELTDEELAAIDALDTGVRGGPGVLQTIASSSLITLGQYDTVEF